MTLHPPSRIQLASRLADPTWPEAFDGDLALVLTPLPPEEIELRIEARSGGRLGCPESLCVDFTTLAYGRDAAEFAKDLETWIARYEGSARFLNTIGNVEITATIVDRGRGIIEFGARITQDARDSGSTSSVITLAGFRTNQSFVPGIVDALRRFLTENGISDREPSWH